MIEGNLLIQTVPASVDEVGERGIVTNVMTSHKEFMEDGLAGVGSDSAKSFVSGALDEPDADSLGGIYQLANIAPLASDANAATIVAKVNAIIAALKNAKVMFRDWTITNTLVNVTTNNTATAIANGVAYSATITAGEGHTLPAAIDVTSGGAALVVDTDYTWNATTGALAIAAVAGDLVITITGASS